MLLERTWRSLVRRGAVNGFSGAHWAQIERMYGCSKQQRVVHAGLGNGWAGELRRGWRRSEQEPVYGDVARSRAVAVEMLMVCIRSGETWRRMLDKSAKPVYDPSRHRQLARRVNFVSTSEAICDSRLSLLFGACLFWDRPWGFISWLTFLSTRQPSVYTEGTPGQGCGASDKCLTF